MTDIYVHPALSELMTDVVELKQHPENYNVGDVDEIASSMRINGIYRPVYAQRSTGFILAGNQSFAAELTLGLTSVPVVWLDVDDEHARRILVGDNLIAQLGSTDQEQLAELISALSDTPEGLAGLGDTPEGLAGLGVTAELLTLLDELSDDLAGADDDADAVTIGKSFDVFDRETIHGLALDHYLGNYPYRSLEVHECMQEINALAALPDESLRLTTLGYAVADTYNSHRLSARVGSQDSPVDAIADRAKLSHGLDMIIEQGSAISDAQVRTVCNFVRGAQACANFRPGFALSMYRRFTKPGDVVLDTSTGYGGRLVGFLASSAAKYVGIDPNVITYEGNRDLALDLAADKEVDLICLPAEDVARAPNDLVNDCDFAFTSPPYFSKEHYSDDETQSYKRYPTGVQWRDGFLKAMLALQFAALKPGAYSVINIADVTISSETYPLTAWTVASAVEAGFEHVASEQFPLGVKRVPGAGTAREAFEPLLIFRKPE